MKTKVIIADDHPVVIQGIRDLLDRQEGFEVIGYFQEGRSLLQSSLLGDADLLLLDLNMPGQDGLDIMRQIKAMSLRLKVIVITAYRSPQLAERCQEAGVHAYLVKSEDLHSLIEHIRLVLSGESIYPDFTKGSSHEKNEDKFTYFDEFLKKYRLTKREVEIIQMVCQDYSSQQIATRLSISSFTVKTHRRNIVRKLYLDDSKIALYRFAQENGLI